uniref:POTRA domain-containing protein n=1 Tax=uncultured Candidatus Melainabacteria bacterium TaxID=2682970 RepID=A0A650EJC8_9BACT|nr:hypothetical protein Melaina855_2170 [uncultured Candidatus Melainabacteria bacterium]
MTDSSLNNADKQQDDFSSVKHSVKHKQTERKIRKKRKKVNRLKAFLRFIVLILLTFLTYEFFKLPGWYLKPDTFKNPADSIEIVNNHIVPQYVINKSLKDLAVPKLPIFLMSVDPIKKELYKIPVMKNIYVRRYGFPARIQIIIRERVPIAIIKTDLKARPTAFFTSDGILITNKQYMNLSKYDSNVLKIFTTQQALQKEISVAKIREIEKIVKAVETYSNEEVEYIDLRKPSDVYVKIKTTSIRLGTLDSTVYERIKRIYTILPQITEVNSKIKYIDLSWDKVNYLKLQKSK